MDMLMQMCSSVVCSQCLEKCFSGHVRYLRGVFCDFSHQRADVLLHILIWVFKAGQYSREDLSLHHHFCQIHRVLRDLA